MTDRDKALIKDIQAGKDDRALSILYKEVLPKVKKLVLKYGGSPEEAKDVFQEAIVVFYRYVTTGKFNETYDIDAFIYGVSRNIYIKQYNKNRHYEPLQDYHDYNSYEIDSLQGLISHERHETLRNLMGQLGDRCKELLTLSVFYKQSMKEICEKMGFSTEDAAKTSNYKCKQKLMKLIKDNPTLMDLFKG